MDVFNSCNHEKNMVLYAIYICFALQHMMISSMHVVVNIMSTTNRNTSIAMKVLIIINRDIGADNNTIFGVVA